MSKTLANMVRSEINNDYGTFFEGVEKLLEIWFSRKDDMTLKCDLRKIPRSRLDGMMHAVKCEIISSSSSEYVDAYILSESSMFISSRRFILKTCGSTTPLVCLRMLMSLVQEYTGYDSVQELYYSRKNFKRPDLQFTPHRNFEEEATLLDQFFPGNGGRAYCMGSMNSEDCWYLYSITPGGAQRRALADRQNLPNLRIPKIKGEADQTLEVLMTDLDPKKMVYFYKSCCSTPAEATQRSGIDHLIPEVIIDDFLFDPCGYSMNGICRSLPGGYMTIHVTPQPGFSYVSFETNIPQKSYKDLIHQVLDIFGPKQFVVTFFCCQAVSATIGLDDTKIGVPEYSDYDVEDLQMCRLPGYDLTYALYSRFPS